MSPHQQNLNSFCKRINSTINVVLRVYSATSNKLEIKLNEKKKGIIGGKKPHRKPKFKQY